MASAVAASEVGRQSTICSCASAYICQCAPSYRSPVLKIMISRPWKICLHALVPPRCSLHTLRAMSSWRYSGSTVGTSVHYHPCKSYVGNRCDDRELSEGLMVGPVVKLSLSIVDGSARHVGNGSPAQRGHSAYIRPLSLPRRVTPYLISEMRSPNGSKGGERANDRHRVASVVASESKYAGVARLRRNASELPLVWSRGR